MTNAVKGGWTTWNKHAPETDQGGLRGWRSCFEKGHLDRASHIRGREGTIFANENAGLARVPPDEMKSDLDWRFPQEEGTSAREDWCSGTGRVDEGPWLTRTGLARPPRSLVWTRPFPYTGPTGWIF